MAAPQSLNSSTTGFRCWLWLALAVLVLARERRPLTEDDADATEAAPEYDDRIPRTRFRLLVPPTRTAPPATDPGREAAPLAWWLCACAAIILAMVAAAVGSAGARPCAVTTTPPGGTGGGAPGQRGWKRLVGGGPPTAPGSLLRAEAAVAARAGLDAIATDPARDGGRVGGRLCAAE